MILIDSSAWINFFRGRNPLANLVDEALESNQAAICGPVFLELHRGFLSMKERNSILPLLGGCRLLEDPINLWVDAGDFGFILKRAGRTVKSMDLLIATFALAYQIPILTSDNDFKVIQKAGIPLELI